MTTSTKAEKAPCLQKKNVHELIREVSARLAEVGIAKSQKNREQCYNFRGIEDIYNAAAPVMAEVGLVCIPGFDRPELTDRKSTQGKIFMCAVIRGSFEFVSTHDGSRETVVTYGMSHDFADKAVNKAMSAAHKYALLQVFCIPTVGVADDADFTTPPPTQLLRPQLDLSGIFSVPVLNEAFRKALADGYSADDISPIFTARKEAILKEQAQLQQEQEANNV